MNPCPSQEELSQYLAGALAADADQALGAHLETCASCQRRLEVLTAVPTARPRTSLQATGERSGTESPGSAATPLAPNPSGSFGSSSSSPLRAKLSDDQLHRLRHLLPSGSSTDAVPEAPAEPPGQSAWPNIPGYEILRVLGHGGMAVVYEARQLSLNRRVALKILRAGDLATPEQLVRFRTEGEIVAHLRHPHIVHIYEVGTHNKQPYFALELMEGGSLAQALAGRPLAARAAAELVETLARAMDYAHSQGIVHRDLNPANILLVSGGVVSGEWSKSPTADHSPLTTHHSLLTPKITDFGLAKHVDQDARLTKTGFVMGTPSYMAPEQIRGQNDRVGPLADVYAWGAILYELLTGRPPFQAPTTLEVMNQVSDLDCVPPSRWFPNVPRDLEVICLKCLQKEPARRYASALALAEDLLAFQQGKPIRARPVSRLERVRKWARRRPAVAALTLTVLALVLLVTVAAPLVAFREARLRGDAEARASDARAAQASEAKLRRDAEQLSLRLTLEKGWSLPEQGQVAEGMLWLVRCLEVAPADDADLQHAIRANLAAWYGSLHPLRAQLPHGAEIAALTFSPDGKCIATGGLDKTVRIWDTRTGQPLGPPLPHEAAIQGVAFRGDGKRLVVATVTPVVYTWDTTSAKLAGEPLKNAAWRAGMGQVILSPDGSHMLVSGAGDRSRLWETESGKAVGAPLQPGWARAFSPDGGKIISFDAPAHSRVQVQEARTGRTVGKAMLHPARVAAAALSLDARLVVLGGEDGTARIWDPLKGEPLSPPLRHHEFVLSVAFSPDGRCVGTSCTDNVVRLWEAPTGRPLGALIRSGTEGNRVVFSPDGSCLAAAGTDGIARLWQVGRRQPEGEPLQHPQTVLGVAFSPDGRRAATACWDGTFQEWDLASHQPAGKPIYKQKDLGMAVAYSPDGARILTAGWDEPSAQQWDAMTRQPVGKAFTDQRLIIDAAYSPDGLRIVTGSAEHTAQLRNARTGEPLGSPLRHKEQVHAVAFHPDGTRILTGSYDKTARVWDARTLQPIGPPLEHADKVSAAVFSPDGALILTTTDGGLAQFWDAATGQPIGEPIHHQAAIRRAVFSPDGRRIVTASHDSTARIWDVATRRSLGPPLEHAGAVKAVAFSPDGRRILTGDATGRAWLWDASQPVVEGDRERFKLWVEVSTGQELDADGRNRSLDFATWDARRRRLAELGGPILTPD